MKKIYMTDDEFADLEGMCNDKGFTIAKLELRKLCHCGCDTPCGLTKAEKKRADKIAEKVSELPYDYPEGYEDDLDCKDGWLITHGDYYDYREAMSKDD